jgi:hypothetical protein
VKANLCCPVSGVGPFEALPVFLPLLQHYLEQVIPFFHDFSALGTKKTKKIIFRFSESFFAGLRKEMKRVDLFFHLWLITFTHIQKNTTFVP